MKFNHFKNQVTKEFAFLLIFNHRNGDFDWNGDLKLQNLETKHETHKLQLNNRQTNNNSNLCRRSKLLKRAARSKAINEFLTTCLSMSLPLINRLALVLFTPGYLQRVQFSEIGSAVTSRRFKGENIGERERRKGERRRKEKSSVILGFAIAVLIMDLEIVQTLITKSSYECIICILRNFFEFRQHCHKTWLS